MTTHQTYDAVVAARGVAPLVRERADAIEENRRLPGDVVHALVEAGLMRLCVPKAYGGPEVAPADVSRAVSVVAEADGSAGWCVMIACTTSSLSCFLAPEWAERIYRDPKVVTGGVYAPNGKAERVSGGWRCTGRWNWGSGTTHSQWISGGCNADNGEFHLAWVPAGDVTIHDTWHVSGLRGTGSNEFSFHGAFVPDGRTVQPGKARPMVDSPLARFPNFNLLASGVASVSIGIARRAITEVVELAQGKKPLFSSKTLSQWAPAQIDLARAEAAVSSAQAYLLDELSRAWDVIVAGGHIDLPQRARVRIACCNAAIESAKAVDLAYGLGGGSSIYATNDLQRCFRDVHVATQHLMVSPRILETAGRVLLGVDGDTSTL